MRNPHIAYQLETSSHSQPIHYVLSVCLCTAVATDANPTMPSTTDDRGPVVCHANANLVRQGDDDDKCVCKPGYTGDGVNCTGKRHKQCIQSIDRRVLLKDPMQKRIQPKI